MMYKIKHKPTGLYFRPLKGGCSNLDTVGKIYDTNYMYNQLTSEEFEYPITLAAEWGRKKKTPKYEYQLCKKIVEEGMENIDLKGKPWVTDHYISMSIHHLPEDWEKEYVEVNITVINEQN